MSAEIWLGSPDAVRWFDVDRLSEIERERYAQLKGERRRNEFAVSRALRFAALGTTSADAAQPSSLSHSGGWAAVARGASGCRIGVDLEFHRPRNLLGIARFAFDPAEIAMIEALPATRQQAVFFTLWTLKESMAKALRLPLLAAARECVFSFTESMGVQEWQGRIPTEQPWLARVFRPRPDMELSVAVIGTEAVDAVTTHEWPGAGGADWPTVVALRGQSGA